MGGRGWPRNETPVERRLRREECEHPNRKRVKRRVPEVGRKFWRCPDCGLRWQTSQPKVEGSDGR